MNTVDLSITAIDAAANSVGDDRPVEANVMNDRTARSLLWLALAQAFLAPTRPEVALAFLDGLAGDLDEVRSALRLDPGDDLAAFRAACRRLGDPQALLVDYSRIFLQPPTLATLNLARYVDGGSNGPCVDALEMAFARAGLAPSERLRDLPDHVSRQMECLGWLAGKGAGLGTDDAETEFANLCLVGALPRLAAQLAERAPESPYTALARIAAQAVERYRSLPEQAPRKRSGRHDTAVGVWRHCDNCGAAYAREKEIQIMARALKEAGLPDAHLALCPDCRDVQKGFFKRAIG